VSSVPPARIVPCPYRRRLVLYALLVLAGLGGLPVAAQIGSGSGVGSSLPPSSVSPSSLAASAISSTVSGQVINAVTGQPVARALVRLNERSILTDHDGKFEFEQNTSATGNVMIVKPGFSSGIDLESANMSLQASQLAAPLRLLLYPEALLTGTMLGPEGDPLPGIPVNVRGTLYDQSGRRALNAGHTQTDSHGNFRVPVPGGSYRIETEYISKDRLSGLAILPVRVPTETSSNTLDEIRIHSGEEQHFDLRPAVLRTHKVTAIVDASEQTMGFARLAARTSDGSTLQIGGSLRGISGEMSMELPQGTYTLVARRNNATTPEDAEATITVPDHDISGVSFHFSPIPSIPVEMVIDSSSTSDNNAPSLPQFNLVLENDQPSFEQESSRVRLTVEENHTFRFLASPGSYHLLAIGGGDWYVKSVVNGGSDVLQQGLMVAPGSGGTALRVTVSDQTGSLQGTVNLNGVPSACWVYLIPITPSAEPFLVVHSNAEGAFTDTRVPPGSYEAIAFEGRHSANFRDPDVLAAFASRLRAITVDAGDKATLDLDAVPSAELQP
jgi:hypothetical protein